MKPTIMACILATAFLFACNTRKATTITTSTHQAYSVPSSVQSGFASQYPGATDVVWLPYDASNVPIDWDLTDWTALSPDDYTVTYTMNGNKYYSWYDANGNWIGSTYAITDYSNGLPAAVNTTVTSRYAGYTIDKVSQIRWKDRTAYDLKLKNGDNKMKVLIDTNGNVLKEKNK